MEALLHQMEQKDYFISSTGQTSLWTQLKAMFALIPTQSASIGSHSACDQYQPHPTRVFFSLPCAPTAAELHYPTGNPYARTMNDEETDDRQWLGSHAFTTLLLEPEC